MLLTSVIRAHLGELFPGREVEAFSQFRITRDSDLEVDDDDVTQPAPGAALGPDDAPLRPGGAARGRQHLPERALEFLLQQFNLADVGAVQGQRAGQPGAPERADRPAPTRRALRFAPLRAGLAGERCCRAAVDVRPHAATATLLLHQPFEIVRAGGAVPARGGATTRRCWRSSRRSTAPAASRR